LVLVKRSRCLQTMSFGFGKSFVSNDASNKYYDSQSGTFISIPGSGGIKLHDSSIKFVPSKFFSPNFHFNDFYKLLKEENLYSFSFSPDILVEDFKSSDYWNDVKSGKSVPKLSIPISSVKQFQLLQKNSTFISDLNERNTLQLELDFSILHCETNNETLKMLESCSFASVRCNLLIAMEALVNNESSAQMMWKFVDIVANLCDRGAHIVDIKLCCNDNNWDESTGFGGILEGGSETLIDNLQEILESCIGLDIEGEPVQSRLSLSGLSSTELVNMALSIGLTRFTGTLDDTSNTMIDFYGVDGLLSYGDPSISFLKTILHEKHLL